MGDKQIRVQKNTPFLGIAHVLSQILLRNESSSIVLSNMFNCARDTIFFSEQLKQFERLVATSDIIGNQELLETLDSIGSFLK